MIVVVILLGSVAVGVVLGVGGVYWALTRGPEFDWPL